MKNDTDFSKDLRLPSSFQEYEIPIHFLPHIDDVNSESEPSILILNDDCLIEVFKYLSVMDLCAMTSTCTRFKNLGRKTFNLRFRSECLCIETSFLNCEPQRILALLRNFGDMMCQLEINFYNSKARQIIMDYVVKYCADTLENLSLKCCVCLDRKLIIDAVLQLYNLIGLQLQECDDKCDARLQHQRQMLTDVSSPIIINASEADDGFIQNLPNLLWVSIGYAMSRNLETDRSILSDFIRRHTDLRELSIAHLSFLDPAIISELADLNKLSIYYCDTDIMPLTKLQNLHILKINYFRRSTQDLLRFFACMEHLQELHLYAWVFLDDQDLFYSGLRSLRNLKVLVLKGCHGMSFYMRFLYSLRHLQELRISIRDLDEITSDCVIELIRNLGELRKFTLYYIPQLFIYREATISFTRSTYQHICNIYERREHKLIIKNYSDDGSDDETEDYGRITTPYECKYQASPVRYFHMERRSYRYNLNI